MNSTKARRISYKKEARIAAQLNFHTTDEAERTFNHRLAHALYTHEARTYGR